MARKKKRKGGYKRRTKKSKKKPVPRTLGGMWRAAPMAVKGGMALSGLEMGTNQVEAFGTSPVGALSQLLKGERSVESTIAVAKEAVTTPKNYKLLGAGIVIHWVNKKTIKLKGL